MSLPTFQAAIEVLVHGVLLSNFATSLLRSENVCFYMIFAGPIVFQTLSMSLIIEQDISQHVNPQIKADSCDHLSMFVMTA